MSNPEHKESYDRAGHLLHYERPEGEFPRMKASNKISTTHNPFIDFLAVFWLPLFVFCLHVFLVKIVHIYDSFPWLDIPMHYLGGLSFAYSFSYALTLLQERKQVSRLDRIVEMVIVFTLVATTAVFWEFGEFLLDHFLGTNLQVSLPNTMQDLLMGLLGAGTLVVYKSVKNISN